MTTTTPTQKTQGPPTEVELVKIKSRHLRGTLLESLADPLTGSIAKDDTHVIKFHGSYQQYDRDVRDERRRQKLEPLYSFMIRTRLPGGVCTPKQWLDLDAIAGRFANGTLRVTTRQAFQVHGVLKGDLKPTMQAINATLIDTLAACGDVNRNVMCNPNPVHSRVHQEVYAWSVKLSEHLLPKTRAYHEIWLDEGQGKELVASTPSREPEHEPLYGDTYLPRKFKAAIAIPPHNDVDIYSQDLGFVAIIQGDALLGFNVLVGGGMGATHGDKETFPRLADVIGFVPPEQMLLVAEHVLKVQRDFGDRSTRKHARLKYTIEDRGIAWFKAELEQRLGFSLAPARDVVFDHNGDRYGWVEGHDGRFHCTLQIDAGRVVDRPGQRARTGLREIAKVHTGDFRLTPNQNVIVAGVTAEARPHVEKLLQEHGLDSYARTTPLRQNALACVALPTCALAMAEAERYLPDLVTRVEGLLQKRGLIGERVHLRVTGCPNGCARPYLAEVALVGKAPGRYNLFLGGDHRGTRLAVLAKENIDEPAILQHLDGLIGAWASERTAGEALGDFLVRTGRTGAAA